MPDELGKVPEYNPKAQSRSQYNNKGKGNYKKNNNHKGKKKFYPEPKKKD